MNDRTAGVVAPTDVDTLDVFAVEVEIQLLRYEITNGSFGLMVRLQEDGEGYGVGHDGSDEEAVLSAQPRRGRPVLDSRPFRPGGEWHTYRMEVRGNELAAFIDGAPVLDATDNTFGTGRIGLWSSGAQLAVRNFRVMELL